MEDKRLNMTMRQIRTMLINEVHPAVIKDMELSQKVIRAFDSIGDILIAVSGER